MASDKITLNLLLITLLSGAAGAVIPLFIKPYLNHRKRIYDRRLRHFNSLVILELRLLDIDATLHDNMIAFSAIIEGAKQGLIMMARPLPLVLEDSFFQDFYVKELNQKLYDVRYDLRRINYDIDNFNRNYGILSDAMMLKQIDAKHFEVQLSGLLAQRDDLSNGLKQLQDANVQLLAYVRVRIKKDTTGVMRHRTKIIQRRVKKVTDKEVQEQVKQHLKDITDNASR